MTKTILTIATALVLLTSCMTEEEKFAREVLNNLKELAERKKAVSDSLALIPIIDIGYFQYERSYNTFIGKSDYKQTRVNFNKDIMSIRTSADYWSYDVVTVMQSDKDIFKALCVDYMGDEYTITVGRQILKTERMSNNAYWFNVASEYSDAFEVEIKW